MGLSEIKINKPKLYYKHLDGKLSKYKTGIIDALKIYDQKYPQKPSSISYMDVYDYLKNEAGVIDDVSEGDIEAIYRFIEGWVDDKRQNWNNLNEKRKMTTNDLRKIIKEEIREMYEPQRAPIKPVHKPEREVEIMEPGEKTEPKPRRRSLQPPKESPDTKPKALKEEDVVDKITKRFVNLKKDTIDEIKVNNPQKPFKAELIDYIEGEYISYDIEYQGVTSYGECCNPNNPNDKEGHVRVPINQDELEEREELIIFSQIPGIEHVTTEEGYTENFYIPFNRIQFEPGDSPSEVQEGNGSLDEISIPLNESLILQKRAGLLN